MAAYSKILTITIAGLLSGPLYASSPEGAQQEAIDKYALKLGVLCGINLTVEYDAASLKKNNKDIKEDPESKEDIERKKETHKRVTKRKSE